MEKKLKELCLHLLDLGKRNRLLNYKTEGYRTIEIINEDLPALFEKIIHGNRLSIFNLDPILECHKTKIDDTPMDVDQYSIGKVKDITRSLLKASDLLAYKKGVKQSKILKVIYREYRQTLMEKGVNPLYVTFGLLEYQEKKEIYYAPLLLIPVTCVFESDGYKIKESEDDIVLNPTLAYLLKTEYQVELPEYQEEFSLEEYLQFVEQKLKEPMRILPHSSFGIYSFLKMNMFNDVMNHIDLVTQNETIRRILGQPITPSFDQDQPIYPVVDADSSQLSAIEAASAGKSFVLQGPPGSGKSQTITNMIATMIANDKKVLFVSEKQAALNVVYENLKRAGIESFSLELHSHKANKKDFINELFKTASLPKYDIQVEAEDVKHKYEYYTEKLEEYRQALHEKIPRLNRSMYQVYSDFLKLEQPNFIYQIQNIMQYDISYLDQCKESLDRYAIVSKNLGYDYRSGRFYGFLCTDLNYIRFQAKGDLEALLEFYQTLFQLKNKLEAVLPIQINAYSDFISHLESIEHIVHLNHFFPFYFIQKEREEKIQILETYQQANQYIEKSTLENFLDLKIIHSSALDAVNEFKYYASKGLKFFYKRYRELKKMYLPFMKLKMNDKDLLIKLGEALEYKKNLDEYNQSLSKLPEGYRKVDYDVILLDLKSLLSLNFDLKISDSHFLQLKTLFVDCISAFKRTQVDLPAFQMLFDGEVFNLAKGDIKTLLKRFELMIEQENLLLLYVDQLDALQRIKKLNFMEYLNMALDHKVELDKLAPYYERFFLEANIYTEIDHRMILKEFSSLGVERIVQLFKEFDESHLEANKAYIISKLSKKRPEDSIVAGSQFSILIREYNKSRKQMPIRMLLKEIKNLIFDIKPVFLMSPLSVSTYLNEELNLFDCVIFDEASQVFTWDALGAIYRSKQCIIIGDSKQMPPSNFFTSIAEDNEESYDEAAESILDCGTSTMDSKRLNWHYRSRSEELIAFSNHEFYDSSLITIPQAKSHETGFGIDFHYLFQGCYEVHSRTNYNEAKYICDLVFQFWDQYPDMSLGVVAFSNAQADLITDILEQRLEKEPLYQPFFAEDREEPFFVKNLESVQGDERDRIIFSICYGYNKENKFYQRFGPLNTLGGERRLNVAITRAKYNICVVSSIKSSDIKLENTNSLGVKLLKKYLAYAENITTPVPSVENTKDGVLLDVASFLEQEGFLVESRIGSSKFKVDLAVLHPMTKSFVCAIMLDGDSYSMGNCTDVNRLQEMGLKRLGWKFYRLFSTLWLNQNQLEKEKLVSFLNSAFQDELEEEEKTKSNFLTINEENFDDTFIKYEKISDQKLKELYQTKSIKKAIETLIAKEEPIHKEYLLKRICFMYGRTKVTNLVKSYFEKDIIDMNILEQNGFLSLHHLDQISLRLSTDRDIEYVHPLELQDAIYKIVKRSNGITKEGCFKNVVQLLGYSRMTEHAISYLEDALVFLKLEGKITEQNECLYS